MNKLAFLILISLFISCKEEKIVPKPTKVSITSIEIKNFPSTDSNNADWDNSSQGTHPDIYFQILNDNGDKLFELPTGDRRENLRIADLPFTFNSKDQYYTFNNLNQVFQVVLYDYDSFNANDFIGGVKQTQNFSELVKDNDLPKTINLEFGKFSFTIGVTWSF